MGGTIRWLAVIACAACGDANAADSGAFSVESEVIETDGTPKEIIARAKICAVQHLRFDSVEMSDAVGSGRRIEPSGSLIVSDDPDAGILVANSRAPFKFMLSKWNAQSLVTILAKEDRFKIQHSNVQAAMLSTGYSYNDGYRVVGKEVRVEKEVGKALNELSLKLADCIKAKPADW